MKNLGRIAVILLAVVLVAGGIWAAVNTAQRQRMAPPAERGAFPGPGPQGRDGQPGDGRGPGRFDNGPQDRDNDGPGGRDFDDDGEDDDDFDDDDRFEGRGLLAGPLLRNLFLLAAIVLGTVVVISLAPQAWANWRNKQPDEGDDVEADEGKSKTAAKKKGK